MITDLPNDLKKMKTLYVYIKGTGASEQPMECLYTEVTRN